MSKSVVGFWRGGEPIYVVIDETQTLKRAKKMDAVGKLCHHATGRYGTGHTILKVSLYCRGVTIPWGSWLYIKKQDAKKLGQSESLSMSLITLIRRSRLHP